MKPLDPSKTKKYLPLGTVVILKNGIKSLMIIGYRTKDLGDNIDVEFDYMGIPYPEGLLNINLIRLFNHDEIIMILSRGYVNEEFIKYNSFLNEKTNEYHLFEILKEAAKKKDAKNEKD